MRTLMLTALLLVAGIAGCINDSDDSNGSIPSPAAYVADGIPDVPAVDAQWTTDTLQTFVKTYPERASNLDHHTGARDWIADQFEGFGLEVYRQQFTSGIDQENILGILWGEVTDEWVVVGGHYDMTTTDCAVPDNPVTGECVTRPFSEGAYDDGSGTLQTVALAKAFTEQYAETGIKPYYTMVFSPFDGEERGLQGSRAFADAIRGDIEPFPYHDGNIRIRGMLNLDMAGLNWPGTEAPLYFDENSEVLRQSVEEWRIEMGMPDDMIQYTGISLGRSDYANFFALGVPTGFFISDFEEWQLPADLPLVIPQGAYPFWHVEDTWETMVLMAGSEEDLTAGFATILDLSARILHQFAFMPDVEFDAEVL